MNYRIGSVLELKVEKMSFGGAGIARHQGLVVFVPFTAPGDRIRARVRGVKKNHLLAELQEILEPGPQRVSAPCPVFGRCGGCQWQHLSYEEQLRQKQSIVKETLEKALKAQLELLPIVPSPKDFRYRNRIGLKSNGIELGYFAKASHELVPIEDCLIAEEDLAKKIPTLKNKPAGSYVLTKSNLTAIDQASGFEQVNSAVNELLVKTTLSWIRESQVHSFFDLYCGSGNFAFPVFHQKLAREVVGVELNELSIHRAQVRPDSSKIKFYLADVEKFLQRYQIPEKAMVVMDPPRAGAGKIVMQSLAYSKLKSLIYISCDPNTLARDLATFFSARPQARVKRVQAFDMFPQTSHVETLLEVSI